MESLGRADRIGKGNSPNERCRRHRHMSSESFVLLQVVILLGSLFILAKSSDLVSDAAVSIARTTGLGEMAVGFLLLSVVTSLPELAISILALESGDVGISIGTLFGSNIANLGLVLGVTAILAPGVFRIARESIKTLSMMLLVSSAVPVLALVVTGLSRFIGLALLVTFGLFCIYYVRSKVLLESDEPKGRQSSLRQLLLAIGGVAAVLVSAQFVVSSSVLISKFLGIEEAVIGATVIALGTSLPELSVSLAAARRNHMNLAMGNILGSCVTNLTLILGMVLALSTPAVNVAVFTQLVVMLLVINLSVWRMLMDNRIGLGDGVILAVLYLVFLASSAGVQVMIFSPEYLSSALKAMMRVLALAFVYGIVAVVAIILAKTLNNG
jgi:cation:H+ antiporter